MSRQRIALSLTPALATRIDILSAMLDKSFSATVRMLIEEALRARDGGRNGKD